MQATKSGFPASATLIMMDDRLRMSRYCCVSPKAQLLPNPQPSPAVVNSVFRSPMRPWLSLDGEWDFALDPQDIGLKDAWYKGENGPASSTPFSRKIQVPGAWEAQEVGAPGFSNPTSVEIIPLRLRHKFVGVAWYRKEFRFPYEWKGKRVWLKIGAVNSEGWFWVNGHYLGHLHSYTNAGFKFETTPMLQEGVNTIVARVSDAVNSRKGGQNCLDQFGGLYRSVELEATPSVYIDDTWAKPDFDNQRAIILVTVASPWQNDADADFSVGVRIKTIPDDKDAGSGDSGVNRVSYTGTEVSLPVVLSPFNPWSPSHPALYKAEVTLKQNGKVIDSWVERFGVRKIERRGTHFYLNGKRFFLRGFGQNPVYPLTNTSPPSREEHRKHLEMARSYGFNYVRTHTNVENPEYFQAADELGIMVQAELPYEGIRPSPPGAYQPLEDLNELYRHYRRYVSLTTYSMGNEGLHMEEVRGALFSFAKLLDPTRLVLHQDGGVNYEGISDYRSGPVNTPVTERDAEGSLPVVLHEYLNLAGPPDPRLEPLFTGAQVPPLHLDEAKEQAKRSGVEWPLAERAIEGGNELQSIYQKLGLEQARAIPQLDGYIFWTIQDTLATMPQGLLDVFWRPKRSSPDYFRQFNSPTTLLLPELAYQGDDPVFSSGERFSHSIACSNYGDDITNADITWVLAAGNQVHLRGKLDRRNIPQGGLTSLGKIDFSMPVSSVPLELTLRVGIEGRDVENTWNFYCFPRLWPHAKVFNASATGPAYNVLSSVYPGLKKAGPDFGKHKQDLRGLLILNRLDEGAFRVLESGGDVLLLSLRDFCPSGIGPQLGWWEPSNQRGTATTTSEAFGDFPIKNGLVSLAIFRLFHEAARLEGTLANRVDPLMITIGMGDYEVPPVEMPPWVGREDSSARRKIAYLASVFQARAGSGRLLASGLDLLSNKPEASYLLDMFIRYVRSDDFHPQNHISLAELRRIAAISPKLER